ncbi:MAG TPA: DegV family protein [Aggregatilineales bacterium]|nr:DegV family protein [Anaerolineales bacterium]HRE47247.1 DegV family protein [Aggregatilineales bacterium]
MTRRVRIVVDSTADVPPEYLARYDMRMIPAFVNFGAESYPDDGIALPRAEFYRRLVASSVLATTSAPSLGVAVDGLRAALEGVDHVVALTLSTNFSGIHNVFQLAAKEIDPARITVYDSGSLSMGVGWQALAAAEAAEQGAPPDAVLMAIREARARVEVWAAPDTLDYLRRGGRVNALVAGVDCSTLTGWTATSLLTRRTGVVRFP